MTWSTQVSRISFFPFSFFCLLLLFCLICNIFSEHLRFTFRNNLPIGNIEDNECWFFFWCFWIIKKREERRWFYYLKIHCVCSVWVENLGTNRFIEIHITWKVENDWLLKKLLTLNWHVFNLHHRNHFTKTFKLI